MWGHSMGQVHRRGECGVTQWERGYKSVRRSHVGWVTSESEKLLIGWH